MGGLGQERKNVMYNYVTEEQVSRYKSLFQSILDRLREKLGRFGHYLVTRYGYGYGFIQ